MNPSLDSLRIPGHLEPVPGNGGLPCFHLEAQGARATVYLHGAHVTAFQPENAAPVLWMSEKSHFEHGHAIRGGVPICWPWFGAHESDPDLPAHGVARLRAWTPLEAGVLQDGRCRLRLGFSPEKNEIPLIPEGLRLEYTITLGNTLCLELESINDGPAAVAVEDALHSYFALGDVKTASVKGLEGAPYLDKLDAMSTKIQSSAVEFTKETDRIYLHSDSNLCVADPAWDREIHIHQSGAGNSVVWNPWIDKSNAMADFGDEEWRGMCCVEAVNTLRDRIQLLPGTCHRTRMEISVTGG